MFDKTGVGPTGGADEDFSTRTLARFFLRHAETEGRRPGKANEPGIKPADIDWLRGRDLNPRPSGYEPDELPGCSTPRLETLSMLILNRKQM